MYTDAARPARPVSSKEETQSIEMDILRECLRIIQRHRFRYFILGGTLLGAVRHKGFIPWDDDIDIGMPRPDYESFLRIAADELPEPYTLVTYRPDIRAHQHYFAKVADPRFTLCLVNTDSRDEVPVWVDIFPLDGVPDAPAAFAWWKRKCLALAKLFTLSQTGYEFDRKKKAEGSRFREERMIRLFLRLRLDRFLNTERIFRSLDRSLKRYDYDASSRLVNLCGHWHMKEMFPKDVYGDGADYPFGDLTLRGPVDYDAVLTQMYGDYMTPPPENMRGGGHGT